jgi:hypothetical protein
MGFMTCVWYVAHCMQPSPCTMHFIDTFPATHADGLRKRIVNRKLTVLTYVCLRVLNSRTEAGEISIGTGKKRGK